MLFVNRQGSIIVNELSECSFIFFMEKVLRVVGQLSGHIKSNIRSHTCVFLNTCTHPRTL